MDSKLRAEKVEANAALFLDQLVDVLARTTPDTDAIGASAAHHGGDLLRSGYTIAQVVHDYGDISQAVTRLTDELHAPIPTAELETLNRCLDDAIAGAVTEYARLRHNAQSADDTERMGILAHEMRNKLGAAMLAHATLKTGLVGIGGSIGLVLDRNLSGLRDLIDRSLADVRVESRLQNPTCVSVAELVEEIEVDASLAAISKGIVLTVARVPGGLEVQGDRLILAAAVTNLLQNAFKFSRPQGQVLLTTSAMTDRVLFEIQDECGGLPPGKAEDLFRPFTQCAANREGLGLGLSIVQRGIEAHGGVVRVRDLPGRGCVFAIELPRRAGTR
jgi:signal transduction histidine kinase